MPVAPVIFRAIDDKEEVGIPIVKLSQNQKINLRFDVQKGIGKMHAKWSPTTIATYRPDPEVKLDENKMATRSNELKKRIYDSCPVKVFSFEDNTLEVTNPERCIFCEECKKVEDDAKESNLIRICKYCVDSAKKKDKFIFTVESSGVLPPITIAKKGIQILRNKLKSLEAKII